ncbi:alanine--tRNA ligase [Candidatus Babeliales bacterium]|nr:alanine--tRNA ligase [Candidatus Babeliales bacterium]
MNSLQIRKKFFDFFQKYNHTVVASSSLIPAEDPTLLFTNAGMNQFKDVFLGKEKRSYKRATSIQKCVRAGGKHNDLDQVGFTTRHLTFFEMMGNFSFGDYFKQEAMQFAWEFLTVEMGLQKKDLYVSVYEKDDESYNIWNKVLNIPEDHLVRLGMKDNFWAMGDTGPCGPCTEIYLDRGADQGCRSATCRPSCDCSRFIEIWNNVFMQYNRQEDGSLKELAQTGVDTGMGLERLCMVAQGVNSVFETDQFVLLTASIEKRTGVSYQQADEKMRANFHVIADHIRSSSLLIADGCAPSNDGRGYVLRKIIRRAALFAQKISDDKNLFSNLALDFIATMKDIYPELEVNKKLICSVLDSEIERFAQNLINGQGILQKYIEVNKQQGVSVISGDQTFKLYDTYGFPPELTMLMGQEDGFTVDFEGFEQEMAKQKELSGKKMKAGGAEEVSLDNMPTKFVGYEVLENESPIQFVSATDDHIWLSTKESPFYVECGGQVNDHGRITINNQTFTVVDLKKSGETFNPAILVKIPTTTVDGKPAQAINVGDTAHSIVEAAIREKTVKNHTATHMLQAALQQILGGHVKQAGSVVNDKHLRFDYAHHQAMTKQEIKQVEDLINQKIQADIKTNIMWTSLKDAQSRGVISFFGEKYNPEKVRIVEIPGFSAELCGGTHASSTGIIGCFKIVSDTALATGTRRIVAITGPGAVEMFQQTFDSVKQLSELFKVKQEDVLDAVQKQQATLQATQTQVKQLKKQLYKAFIPAWHNDIEQAGKVQFLYLELDDASADDMKQICTDLSKDKPGFYFLVSKATGRFTFFGYVSKECPHKIDLKQFAQFLQTTFNLKGGGSDSFLQGGGSEIPKVLKQELVNWLERQ